MVLEKCFLRWFFIWLILFQLLNLHLWQAAHCTLHTAQRTLHTVPANANWPESAPLHFIIQINTVHCMPYIYTKCAYSSLHTETSNSCLSDTQDLHCKMNTKICCLLSALVNLYQGLFCHDQVSSGKYLEFFNLWRNLQLFLDTMEPRTESTKLWV